MYIYDNLPKEIQLKIDNIYNIILLINLNSN